MVPRHALRPFHVASEARAVLIVFACTPATACLPDLDPSLLDVDAAPASACSGGVPDGIVQQGEECDDGNMVDGDGCTMDCTLACEGTLDPVTGACYFAVGPDVLLTEATDRCRDHGATANVASMHSHREREVVQREIEAAGYSTAMAGLFAINAADLKQWWSSGPKEPGWSADCPGCYAYWDPSEPLPTQLRRVAVTRPARQWRWAAESAESRYGLVCERPRPGLPANACVPPACDPAGTTEFYAFGHHYRVRDVAVGVIAASKDCEAWGGTLWVWDSVEEREAIVRFGPSTRFWVGLVRKPGGDWYWADGKTAAERPIPWSSAEIPANATVAVLGVSAAFDTSLVQAVLGGLDLPYVCRK